jgi:hypothetical protein
MTRYITTTTARITWIAKHRPGRARGYELWQTAADGARYVLAGRRNVRSAVRAAKEAVDLRGGRCEIRSVHVCRVGRTVTGCARELRAIVTARGEG